MLTLLWPVVASASDISWRFSRPKNSHLWELHPIHSQEHARAKPSMKYHEMVQQEAQNISNLFPTGKSWQIPASLSYVHCEAARTCAAFQHCFHPPSPWAVHQAAKPYTSRGQWRQLSAMFASMWIHQKTGIYAFRFATAKCIRIYKKNKQKTIYIVLYISNLICNYM